jgi:hypothetical protein
MVNIFIIKIIIDNKYEGVLYFFIFIQGNLINIAVILSLPYF